MVDKELDIKPIKVNLDDVPITDPGIKDVSSEVNSILIQSKEQFEGKINDFIIS